MVRIAIPPELRPFYFDFDWENERVWAERAPGSVLRTRDLAWHLDMPIWSTIPGMPGFDLCPREVLQNPRRHAEHFLRLRTVDLTHPLDLMWNRDRLVILDGVHRLARHALEGREEIRARRIPRAAIPRIRR